MKARRQWTGQVYPGVDGVGRGANAGRQTRGGDEVSGTRSIGVAWGGVCRRRGRRRGQDEDAVKPCCFVAEAVIDVETRTTNCTGRVAKLCGCFRLGLQGYK